MTDVDAGTCEERGLQVRGNEDVWLGEWWKGEMR
jgi:hypothetical protein